MNATASYEISIVIPICCQEESLPDLFKAIDDYKARTPLSFCVIFVNDASTDNSESLIRNYCMRNNDAFFLNLLSRSGLTASVKAAIDRVNSKYVGFFEPELLCPFDTFDKLYAMMGSAGMACGEREFPKKITLRRLVIRLMSAIRRRITQDGLHDASCPVKLAKTHLIKNIPWFSGIHYLLPALVILKGERVSSFTVGASSNRSKSRKSTLKCELVQGSIDLLVFMWMKCRYIDPAVRDGNLSDKSKS